MGTRFNFCSTCMSSPPNVTPSRHRKQEQNIIQQHQKIVIRILPEWLCITQARQFSEVMRATQLTHTTLQLLGRRTSFDPHHWISSAPLSLSSASGAATTAAVNGREVNDDRPGCRAKSSRKNAIRSPPQLTLQLSTVQDY